MMILRLPEGVADDNVMEIVPQGDDHHFRVLFASGTSLPAKLMPLTTSVEVHQRRKEYEDGSVLKRADVGQILHVFLTEEDMTRQKMGGGLTAPMMHATTTPVVAKHRHDPRDVVQVVQDVVRGVRERQEVEYAIVDSQPWMRDGDVLTLSKTLESLILAHPETFFSMPCEPPEEPELEEEPEEDPDEDWMIHSSDEDEYV